jgi:hypothetical protein
VRSFPFVLLSSALSVVAVFSALVQTALPQQFITPRNVTPGPAGNSNGYPVYGGVSSDVYRFVLPPILDVSDFNLDHRPDILTTYNPNGKSDGSGTPSFALLMNNGDGTFTRHVLTNVVYPPNITACFSAKIADVNGDGKPDLVIINCTGENAQNGDPIGPSTLHVYLGNGDGTFRPLTPQAVSPTLDATILVAADLNGDGKADLVIDMFDNDADIHNDEVLLNNGSGVFHLGPALPGSLPEPLFAADMYGEGHMDLVLPGRILKNDGTGKFTPGATFHYGSVSAIGDLNHDGRNDLVVSAVNSDPNPFSSVVLLNQGGGVFTQSAVLTTNSFAGQVIDVNHDGIADLAVSGLSGLVVFLGKGDGTFAAPTIYDLGFLAVIEDFNGDGNLDALTSEGLPFLLTPGDGHGGFAAPKVTSTALVSTTPVSIATGDFNGDKKTDVAVVNQAPCFVTGPGGPFVCPHATVSVSAGTGLGYLGPPHYFPVGVPTGVMAVGDVNGDGKLDIVVTRGANLNVVRLATNYDVSVLLGRGDGTFLPAKNYRMLPFPPSNTLTVFDAAVYLLDVNKDGRLDLVGDWGVALGNGDGSFKPPIALPTGLHYITGLVPGDFNRDGKVDLEVATADGSTQSLVTLLGNGKGSFTIAHTTPFVSPGFPQSEISAIAAADLNGDGIPDLIYSGNKSNSANGTSTGFGTYVQLAHGDGTFATPVKYPGGDGFEILTGDFNRDGHVDVLVSGDLPNGDLAMYKGIGKGALSSTPEMFSTSTSSNTGQTIAVVNLNADTALDVVGLVINGFARVINTGVH